MLTLRPPRLNIRYSGEDEILRCHAPYAVRREDLIGTVQSRPEKGQIVAKNDEREKYQDQHDDDLCGRCRDESHLLQDEGESDGMGGKEDARGANHYGRNGDGNVRDAQDQYEMNEKVHSPLHSLRDLMTRARREPPLPPDLCRAAMKEVVLHCHGWKLNGFQRSRKKHRQQRKKVL